MERGKQDRLRFKMKIECRKETLVEFFNGVAFKTIGTTQNSFNLESNRQRDKTLMGIDQFDCRLHLVPVVASEESDGNICVERDHDVLANRAVSISSSEIRAPV